MAKTDTRDSEAKTGDSLPRIPELERLKLHNLILQQQLQHEQLNGLILKFLQTTQPRELQEKIEDITRRINEMAAEIFSTTGVSPQEYQLNIERGAFVPKNAE